MSAAAAALAVPLVRAGMSGPAAIAVMAVFAAALVGGRVGGGAATIAGSAWLWGAETLLTGGSHWTGVALVGIGGAAISLAVGAAVASRQAALDAARAAERHFAALRAATATVGTTAYYALDSHGRIRYWDETAAALFGHAAPATLGEYVGMLFPADDAQRGAPMEVLQAAAASGRACVRGLRQHADGRVLPVEETISASRSGREALLQFSVVTQDLSELARTAQRAETLDAWLRVVLESAGDAVVVTDHAGQLVRLNGAAERLFALPQGGGVGRRIDTLLPAIAMHEDMIVSESPRVIATAARRSDGSACPVAVTIRGIAMPDDLWYVLSVRDRSTHGPTGDEAHRHTARFQSLVDASDRVVWVLTAHGAMLDPSLSWRSFTGQDVGAAEGTGWLDAVHGDDRATFTASVARGRDVRRAWPCQMRVRSVTGEYRVLDGHLAPVLGDDGGVLEWVAALADVTATRRRDEEHGRMLHHLETERTQLAAIVDRLPSLLCVVREPDLHIELANAAFVEMFPTRDPVGHPAAGAIPPVLAPIVHALLQEVRTTARPAVRHATPITDGAADSARMRLLDVVLRPLPRTSTTASRLLLHAVDVTEAAEARRAITDANEARARFIATISHEFRTPLNGILGYMDLLELEVAGPLSDAQRDYLRRMRASGTHLMGLIGGVLDLARVDAGQVDLATQELPILQIVHDSVEVVRPHAVAKRVRLLEPEGDTDRTLVVGDADRVRQIVLNLLTNAIAHTPASGDIVVTCGRSRGAVPAGAYATTPIDANAWYGYIQVEDSGPGIHRDAFAHIFLPFAQLAAHEDGASRAAVRGAGLGLPISRELARLMGGAITVESVLGGGSAFTLWLPLAAAAHPGNTPAHDPATARGVSTMVAPRARLTLARLLAAHRDRIVTTVCGPETSPTSALVAEIVSELAQYLGIGTPGALPAYALRSGDERRSTAAWRLGAARRAHGWSEAALREEMRRFRETTNAMLHSASASTGGGERLALMGLLESAEREAVVGFRAGTDVGAPTSARASAP